MQDSASSAETRVVELIRREARRGWLGLGRQKVDVPTAPANTEVRLVVRSGGRAQLRALPPGAGGTIELAVEHVEFVRARTDPQAIRLEFASVATDKAGHAYDLVLAGSCTIVDLGEFAFGGGLDVASEHVPMTPQLAGSWLAGAIDTAVRDQVRSELGRYSIDEIRDKDVLPKAWWDRRLRTWLSGKGVGLSIDRAGWESEDARRAEAQRVRQEQMRQMAGFRRKERDLEVQEAEATGEYQAKRAEILARRQVSDLQRRHELQILQLEQEKQRALREKEIDDLRQERERAALEHEVTLAGIRRSDEDAQRVAQQAQRVMEQMERRYRQLADHHARTAQAADRLRTLPDLLHQAAEADPRRRYEAAERLVQEHDIPGGLLSSLGCEVLPQELVSLLNRKMHLEGRPVQLRMAEITTRDIGVKKVNALTVNSSLRFEFQADRAGCVTVLNIGTSGNVWLHVPNVWVPPDQARVEMRTTYAVPGHPLLPLPPGLDYVEAGPGGWEHVAVLVTDSPLAAPSTVQRSGPDMPFVMLSNEELNAIGTRLADMEADEWSAGLLSFLVQDRL